jgi:glutamate synthase (NADPH) large chain
MEANGCEYMTGGTVVSLGPVGDNFAAGMTGGMAFVWEPEGRLPKLINPDSVVWQRIGSDYWRTKFEDLLERHVLATGSPLGRRILDNLDAELGHVWQVIPKEMLTRLAEPLEAAA